MHIENSSQGKFKRLKNKSCLRLNNSREIVRYFEYKQFHEFWMKFEIASRDVSWDQGKSCNEKK